MRAAKLLFGGREAEVPTRATLSRDKGECKLFCNLSVLIDTIFISQRANSYREYDVNMKQNENKKSKTEYAYHRCDYD